MRHVSRVKYARNMLHDLVRGTNGEILDAEEKTYVDFCRGWIPLIQPACFIRSVRLMKTRVITQLVVKALSRSKGSIVSISFP